MPTYNYQAPKKTQVATPEMVSKALKLELLLSYTSNSSQKDFVQSLIWCVTRAGRAWSEKQLYWVDKYIETLTLQKDITKDEATTKKTSLLAKSYPNLAALFAKVINKHAYPKLTYTLDECKLQLAYSATYKSLAVRVGGRSVGALNLDGSMNQRYPVRDDKLLACLDKIEEDPVRAAQVSGKHTGYCCFCSRELTDERSVKHGYGPICADNWGLPWDDLTSEEKKSMKISYRAAEL